MRLLACFPFLIKFPTYPPKVAFIYIMLHCNRQKVPPCCYRLKQRLMVLPSSFSTKIDDLMLYFRWLPFKVYTGEVNQALLFKRHIKARAVLKFHILIPFHLRINSSEWMHCPGGGTIPPDAGSIILCTAHLPLW